jgi:uroporphyrinogen decarboxylase
MTSRELVDRAIRFRRPERLPFWQHVFADVPDDVCDCWEMDRGKGGWFFDQPVMDDWHCGWAKTEKKNMGQVVEHPLREWSRLAAYRPPDPRDPWYFERLEGELAKAGERYAVVTSHFNLFERTHMLHGFAETLIDLYDQPQRVEKLVDMVLEWKLVHFQELRRRFGGRVHGLFLTDDWGTQEAPIIGAEMFRTVFLERYKVLFKAIHDSDWHVILHSCGRVNDFVPLFIEAGVDVLNMQQPRCYGIEELGRRFAGKVAFLTTADIQATLPTNDPRAIRAEAELLVKHWSTPAGGFIVFNYGDPEALGIAPATARIMFDAFMEVMWR